jgi:glycerol-1-phosphate dehydrogenase [NAD(P)+]
MKTSSTNVLHAGKYFPRPVEESTKLRHGPGEVISWVSAFPGQLLFLGDANTLAALRHLGAGARPQDTVVDLGAPARLDDALVDRARTAIAGRGGALVAVGGGTLNDLAKLLAAERGAPFTLVATCASMNGWVSPNASIVRAGNKISVRAVAPACVILDPGILDAAPRALTSAGVADALSGRFACRDWQLAAWSDGVGAASFDAEIAAGVRGSLVPLEDALAGDRADSPASLAPLLDALVAGGVAMREAHSSAPASGAEHLVAHAIDLHEIAAHAPPTLHGHAVAIGMLVSAALWEELAEGARDGASTTPALVYSASITARAEALTRLLPTLALEARSIVEAKVARELTRGDPRAVLARALAEEPLPSVAAIRATLARAGAPTRAHEVDVDRAFLRDTLLHARDMRDRTTVFDLAFALGVLPARAEAVLDRSGLA